MASVLVVLLISAPLVLLLADLARPSRARRTRPAPFAGRALETPRPVPRYVPASAPEPSPHPGPAGRPSTSAGRPVVSRPVAAAADARLDLAAHGPAASRPPAARVPAATLPARRPTPAAPASDAVLAPPADVPAVVNALPDGFTETPHRGETSTQAAARRRRRGLAERRAAKKALRRDHRADGLLAGAVARRITR